LPGGGPYIPCRSAGHAAAAAHRYRANFRQKKPAQGKRRAVNTEFEINKEYIITFSRRTAQLTGSCSFLTLPDSYG
ncbi:hypothetical protein ACVXJK_005361, partial [Salmonella enterica]